MAHALGLALDGETRKTAGYSLAVGAGDG